MLSTLLVLELVLGRVLANHKVTWLTSTFEGVYCCWNLIQARARFQRIKKQAMLDLKFIQIGPTRSKDGILSRKNSNYYIIAILDWAEDKVTSSPQKMEMEVHCLGHESLKTAILSRHNDHFDVMQFWNHSFCAYRMRLMRSDPRTSHRDRPVGKGRVRVKSHLDHKLVYSHRPPTT